MLRILDVIETVIVRFVFGAAVVLLPLLIGVRVYEIYTRKVLNAPSAFYHYVEAEAFLLLVFFSLAFAYYHDAHVRVDIIRERLSGRTRAWIELIGAAVFMLPLVILVIRYGSERAYNSYDIGERSALAFGRPWGWIIDAALPFGMALFGAIVVCVALRNLFFLLTGQGRPSPPASRDLS